MTGRTIVIALLLTTLVAGAAMYWLQLYAFYDRLDPADVTLNVTEDGTSRPLAATITNAIDSSSSPIRFRACFDTAEPVTGDPHPNPTPLVAPNWLTCFDAPQIGADIETGTAIALMGARNIEYGIDRVLAVYPDGRGVAWDQINECGRETFEGKPPPATCPPPPEPQ